MQKLRDDLITASDYQRIFGVSRRTARRWDLHGAKPHIVAIARLVKLQDLGAIDPAWDGWKIRSGRLYDPLGSKLRGWAPEQVRALEYLHDHRRALELQLTELRAKAGLARGRIAMFPGDRRRWDRRQAWIPLQEAAARPRLSAMPETVTQPLDLSPPNQRR